jgi:hypothetical protein
MVVQGFLNHPTVYLHALGHYHPHLHQTQKMLSLVLPAPVLECLAEPAWSSPYLERSQPVPGKRYTLYKGFSGEMGGICLALLKCSVVQVDKEGFSYSPVTFTFLTEIFYNPLPPVVNILILWELSEAHSLVISSPAYLLKLISWYTQLLNTSAVRVCHR